MEHGNRSALKKVVEQDLPAAMPLVLCVAAIIADGPPHSGATALELTDGWYSTAAAIDAPLAALVARNKLQVKMMRHNAAGVGTRSFVLFCALTSTKAGYCFRKALDPDRRQAISVMRKGKLDAQ